MRNSFIGRETELADLEVIFERGQGVCIRGPAGSGKSSLCDVFVTRLDPDVPVLRITAALATQPIAYGALAPLLSGLPATPAEPVQMLALATSALRAHAGRSAFVLAVDDVHLLDSESATVVHQLSRESGISLMTCCPEDARLPRWVKRLIQADVVADYRLDLLSRPSLDLVAADLLGGPPDAALADDLWDLCRGNPLRARELIEAAMSSNGIAEHNGLRIASRPLEPAGLMATRLDELLEAHSPDEIRVIALTAVNRVVPLQLLEDAESPGAVEKLEASGVLTIVTDGNRHRALLSDRLLERHVVIAMPVTRSRRLVRFYADWLAVFDLRRSDDEVELASRRIAGGASIEAAVGLVAARDALARGDVLCAERVCRAVPTNERTIDINLTLAETQFLQHQIEDADRTLHVARRRSQGDIERSRIAIARAELAVRANAELERAEFIVHDALRSVTDPHAIGLLEAHMARRDALRGSPARALDMRPCSPESPPALQVAQLAAIGAAHLLLGDNDLAIADAEAAMMVTGLDHHTRAGFELVALTHVEALVGSGRLTEARKLLALPHHASVGCTDARANAFGALLDGKILAMAGAIRPAAAAFGRAIDDLDEGADADVLAHARAERAMCHAYAAEAELLAADLSAISDKRARADHRTFIALRRASAWAGVIRGETESAAKQLHHLASGAADEGCVASALQLWHDCVRVGHPHMALDGLGSRAAGTTNALADTYLMHAQALISGSGEALDQVSDFFASLGVHLLATEAAHHAASAHRSRGDLGAGRRSALRADAWMRECEGARTPALRTIEAVLTRRQKQVASLAPFHSNNEIALRLSISVRTVENHLNAVFNTLDIHERSKLASVFLASESL